VNPQTIHKGVVSVNKQEVRGHIEQVGIIPAVRVSSTEDALFAAEAVSQGGIPILEVTLTVPDAHKVISHLVQNAPDVIVGAGGIRQRQRRISDSKMPGVLRLRKTHGGDEKSNNTQTDPVHRAISSVMEATFSPVNCPSCGGEQ
jgi:hypothetical protein